MSSFLRSVDGKAPIFLRNESVMPQDDDWDDEDSPVIKGSAAAARVLSQPASPRTPQKKRDRDYSHLSAAAGFPSPPKRSNTSSSSSSSAFSSPTRSKASSSSTLPPTPQRGYSRRSLAKPPSEADKFQSQCQSLVQFHQCLKTPNGYFPVVTKVLGQKHNFVDVFQLQNSDDLFKIMPEMVRDPKQKLPNILVKRISQQRLMRDSPEQIYQAFRKRIENHAKLLELIKENNLPVYINKYLNLETAAQDGFILEYEVEGDPLCSKEPSWIADSSATFANLKPDEKILMGELRSLFTYLPEFKESKLVLDPKRDNGMIVVLPSDERVIAWFDLISDQSDMGDFDASIQQALRSYFPNKPNPDLFRYLFSGLIERFSEEDIDGNHEIQRALWNNKIQKWQEQCDKVGLPMPLALPAEEADAPNRLSTFSNHAYTWER